MTIGDKSKPVSSLVAREESTDSNSIGSIDNKDTSSKGMKQNRYVPKAAKSISKNDKKQASKSGDKPVKTGGSLNEKNFIEVHLSSSLKKKLKEKAEEEGVDLNDLISELLAEGVALRAWEIIERKNAMRHQNTQYSSSNYRNSRWQSGNRPRGQHTGGSKSNNFSYGYKGTQNNHRNNTSGKYNNIMEDNANFLEYVRNQEKKPNKWS